MKRKVYISLFLFLGMLSVAVQVLGQKSGSVGEGIITLTTAKNIGETIELSITAEGSVSIEGVKEQTESGDKSYTLTAQKITIRGNVTALGCSKNKLTNLDVSGCTTLTTLECFLNQLTTLDLSHNTALTDLTCGQNELTELNISGCTALTTLGCENNQLTNLDVSGCTALTTLECEENQLKTLHLSGCAALTTLECYTNQLTSLDVSGCAALTMLECYNNQLTNFSASNCTALAMLSCWQNQLITLDVSSCTALISLECEKNQLTSLNVSGCAALNILYCYSNQLTTLDLSKNTALNELWCYDNQIKGEEMTRLVKSLPDLTGEETGNFLVIQVPTPDGNWCLKSDVAIAKKKNWQTMKLNLAEDPSEAENYEGAEPSCTVTFTQEGEGTIEIFGAVNLNAVESGTELVVLATPAKGYELTALTANDSDILTTKKFIVKADTEVKATFTKETAAEVVEAGALRLYPNPASTYVNVRTTKSNALVRLYDANGTLRYEAHTDADGTLQIDLSGYAEGTYLLRVGDDAQRLLIRE